MNEHVHPDEDELRAYMSIDYASDEDRRQRDTISDLPERSTSVPESGRDGPLAGECVYHDTYNEIEGCVGNLEHE